MTIEKTADEQPDAKPDAQPLAPGVWVTEATGFAAVPPRAQSDLADVCEEQERKQDQEKEPRIERYRER
jgi:hypothetical protein